MFGWLLSAARVAALAICGLFLVRPEAQAQQWGSKEDQRILALKIPAADLDAATAADVIGGLLAPSLANWIELSKPALEALPKLGKNSWKISRKATVWGHPAQLDGTMTVALPNTSSEAKVRIDGRIVSDLDLGMGLKLKGSGVTVVVTKPKPPMPAKVVAYLSNMEVDFNKATMNGALIINGLSPPTSFVLGSNGVKPAGLLPVLAGLPAIQRAEMKTFKRDGSALHLDMTINGKAVALDSVANADAAKNFTVTGDDLSLPDFVPGANRLPFVSRVQLDKLSVLDGVTEFQGRLNSKRITVNAAADKLSMTAQDGLKLSDLLDQARGIPLADTAAFTALNLSKEGADYEGTVKGKTVTFTHTPQDGTTVITAQGLTAADVLPELEVLDDVTKVALDKVTIAKEHVETQLTIDKRLVDVYVSRAADPLDRLVALYFSEMDPAMFIPDAAAMLPSVAIKDGLLITAAKDRNGKARARTMGLADLPGDLATLAKLPQGATLSIGDDAAFTGTLDISQASHIRDALKDVSVTQTSFPIAGNLSPQALNLKMLGAGIRSLKDGSTRSALLARLNIKAPLGQPKVPGLSDVIAPSGPLSVAIRGNNDAAQPRLLVNGEFPVSLTLNGSKADLLALVALDKGLNGQASATTVNVALDKAWVEPMGVHGLTVTEGGFVLAIGATKDADLTLTGQATYGENDKLAVTADLVRKDGKITLKYFEFVEAQGFTLAKLPGFGSVPGAQSLELDGLKLSPDGVEAKTKIGGTPVDAFLFHDANGGGVLAIDQKGLKLASLISELKETPLKDLTLGNAALVLSANGVDGNPATMNAIAKDLFTDIFGGSNAGLSLPKGIAIAAEVDFAKFGTVGTALKKLGVHEDSAVIMGAVTGPFGSGAPSIDLSVVMEKAGEASGLPKKAMSYKAGTAPGFFVQWKAGELDVGARTAMLVKAGHDELTFDAAIEADLTKSGVGLKVLGSMDGTWHQPFGIKPLSLTDVKMETGIDDLGNVSLGFSGTQALGDEKASMATEIKFALEDGLPDAVAFSGNIDVLGVQTVIEIVEAFVGEKGHLANIQVPWFSIHKPTIAFATPGATDPQLGLVSDGFAFAGNLFFMNTELGRVNGSAGSKGAFFKGAIDDFQLGGIKFSRNDVDFAISTSPKYILNSDIQVFSATSRVVVDLEPPVMDFIVIENLGDMGDAELKIEMTGLDLKTGKFDANADIDAVGHFKSDIVPYLKKLIHQGMTELRQAADQKLEEDRKALDTASTKVDGINQQIQDVRKRLQRERAKAEERIAAAKKKVAELNDRLTSDNDKIEHCGSKLTHPFCKAYWKVDHAVVAVAEEVAEGVLDAAAEAVNIALDFDPEILALKTERDAAQIGLAIAKAVVKTTEDLVNKGTAALDSELSTVLSNLPFNVHEIFFAGDLRSMIADDTPLIIDMSYSIFGYDRHDYFAFKLKDPEFNFKSFAALPALALDKVIDNLKGKIPDKWASWLKSHIGSALAAATSDVHDEVLKAEAKFQKVLATMEDHTGQFADAAASVGDDRVAIASQYGPADFVGPSHEFSTTYIAVGHSALCLAVAPDGRTVHQEACHDVGAERWSTKKVEDGYVQMISNGLCLQARDSVSKNPALRALQMTALALGPCDDKNLGAAWKVVSYDGLYYQVMNRASQKCLHFENESSVPEKAGAVWTSCLGLDSQTFRPIKDAERATYVVKNASLQNQTAQCLMTTTTLDPATNTKVTGYIGGDCNEKAAARFDYLEFPDGGMKLISLADGNCVMADKMFNKMLLSVPCNRSEAMVFDVLESGQFFKLRARNEKGCIAFLTNDTETSYQCDKNVPEIQMRWFVPGQNDN